MNGQGSQLIIKDNVHVKVTGNNATGVDLNSSANAGKEELTSGTGLNIDVSAENSATGINIYSVPNIDLGKNANITVEGKGSNGNNLFGVNAYKSKLTVDNLTINVTGENATGLQNNSSDIDLGSESKITVNGDRSEGIHFKGTMIMKLVVLRQRIYLFMQQVRML